jgi:hypothetical protein
VTAYEYTPGGRLVSATVTREPRFTEQDRGELLALALYRTWLCPDGCGFLAEDTFSHEETGPVFSTSHQACRATLAMLEGQRAATNPDKPNPNARARVWRVLMRRKG